MSTSFYLTDDDDTGVTLEIERDQVEALEITAPLDTSSFTVPLVISPELLGAAVIGTGVAEGTVVANITDNSFDLSVLPIKDIKKAKLVVERRLPSVAVASVRINLSKLGDRTNVRAILTAGGATTTTFIVS